MADGERVAQVALSELQSAVKGVPNKYTRWYGLTASWCAMFVTYCTEKARVSKKIVPKTASVATLYSFAKDNSLFKSKSSGYKPKAGDIMIQKSNGASHTGIVVSASGNGFVTVEGNSGNAVRRCSYTLSNSSLTGFFTPMYEESKGENNQQELTTIRVEGVVDVGKSENKRIYNSIASENIVGGIELHIINGSNDYVPITIGDIRWITRAVDSAGRLEFTVLKDRVIDILEGNTVIFRFNGEDIFYGYLFEKTRTKDGLIHCIAYDQLRYFKNRDTMTYINTSYTDLVRNICTDYKLQSGSLTDSNYILPFTVEDNQTLFDMCKAAREATLVKTGKRYILYDEFGKLNLKEESELATDYLICDKTAEDFYNMTTIDDEVYNTLVLYADDDEMGQRNKFVYKDSDTIASWGVLQQTRRLAEGELTTGHEKELEIYNRKKRVLKALGCFGDTALFAGASVYVTLDVGDVIYKNEIMYIAEAVHYFGDNYRADFILEER